MAGNSKSKVALVSIARNTFDMSEAAAVHRRAVALLAQCGEVVSGPDPLTTAAEALAFVQQLPREVGALVVVQATFADGSAVAELARGWGPGLVLWGVPEPEAAGGPEPGRLRLNAFCGLNLAAYTLNRLGHPYAAVFGPLTAETATLVWRRARAFAAVAALRGRRLLTLGRPPVGFFPSEHDPAEIERRFGVRVVPLSLEEVFRRAEQVGEGELQAALARPELAGLAGLEAVPSEQVARSVRAELAVSRYAREQGVALVATECWPDFMVRYGGAACWMMSRLTDQGIPAACETDVCGAITMFLQQQLTDQAPFFADLVQVDPQRNEGVFWHCGAAPLSLAGRSGPARASVQPNRKVGLTLEFSLREGPVTIAKIGRGRDDFRLFLTTGEAVDQPARFRGNTLTVRFHRPVTQLVETILEQGLDHHYAVAYGHIDEELRWCARALQLPVIEL